MIYDKWCGFCNEHFQTTNPLKVYCKPSHKVRAAELRRRLKSLEPVSMSKTTEIRV